MEWFLVFGCILLFLFVLNLLSDTRKNGRRKNTSGSNSSDDTGFFGISSFDSVCDSSDCGSDGGDCGGD